VAVAVPAGTPVVTEEGITDLIPTAGPYYLASHTLNKSAVLRRNPNYPGPRKAGFDAFVFRMLIGNDPAIARIENGEGDIVAEQYNEQEAGSGSPQMQRGGELERRYGNGERPRYRRTGLARTFYIQFNTLRAPFSDVRLRKAVDLAVDRRELATFWDARPADLFIPPGLKAHRRQGTLYPLEGPRLASARRLTHGLDRPVILATDFRGAMIGMAEALKRQLARIGLRVRIVADWGKLSHAAARYDMVLDSFTFDYVDDGLTLGPVLDAVHAGYDQYPHADLFDDPKWIARIREVERYTGARREAAYARLDRDLAAGPSPLAVLGHAENAYFFSDRVGCKRFIGVSASLDLVALCPV
jgi:ABC-type transport system substrate-binding protein